MRKVLAELSMGVTHPKFYLLLVAAFLTSMEVASARQDMLGGGGGSIPITTFPGQGFGSSSPAGNALGSLVGRAAADHMQGRNGMKCRNERRQGGSIPEC